MISEKKEIQNPIVQGFYADPEVRFYEGKYWIYVTQSITDYEKQLNIDAFSSTDLIHWEKHENIIAMEDFPWIWRAVWAPTIIKKEEQYYLIFATNDIQNNNEVGGLEIAVADSPQGPFSGYLGQPLIDKFINGAQPIDAHLFLDDDETVYLYYGGWGHCNIAKMNETMNGFVPLEGEETFREITPEGYVEGPCMLKKNGKYYFMWSEGGWTDGTYRVSYCKSDNPLGPFKKGKVILRAQPPLADGPGHHGYIRIPDTNEWYIVYHRRIIGDTDPGHRVLCIDRMWFEDEEILPIQMT